MEFTHAQSTERLGEMNQSADARLTQLSENGRSEAVKRRTKRHFEREDQFFVWRLAGNGSFQLCKHDQLRG